LSLKTDRYDLDLKITSTVSWFGPQNQAGFSLSVAPQNRRREVDVGHASRSSDLLYVEASRIRVSQSYLKTGGGATAGGAIDCIGPYYPCFIIFILLDLRGIIVL
jgi:hypothetical protein